jgi:hypothetical protein
MVPPRNENEVSFREYIDNRFKAIEQRFEERWKAHEEIHAMGQRALDTALLRSDDKFESVNKFREQILQERTAFLRQDVYEREHKALELKVDANGKWIDNMTGRLWAAGAIILALSTGIGLLLRFWGK